MDIACEQRVLFPFTSTIFIPCLSFIPFVSAWGSLDIFLFSKYFPSAHFILALLGTEGNHGIVIRLGI